MNTALKLAVFHDHTVIRNGIVALLQELQYEVLFHSGRVTDEAFGYFYTYSSTQFVRMKEKISISKVYDTVLSIPGMQEPVKLQLKLSRKQIFFLSKVITRGTSRDPAGGDVEFASLPEGLSEELNNIAADLLDKAGLTAMNEKLNGL